MHKKNLVHRDVKPSNIMVSVEEESTVTAKIIDLGLAKAVNDPRFRIAISIPGGFAGTPEFASPEQFAGVQADIRSDLYSLGVTLWTMLIGQTPFRGTAAELMYQHLHAPLPLEQLKGVPQPVVVLLEVLLEKDLGRRFQNPAELLKAMATIRVGAPSNRFGKLAALFVAHIAGRRADQARRGKFLHVLRHVDLNQGVGVTKHELGQGTCQKRFSDAGRTHK